MTADAFVPAAGHRALTRFYDRAMALTMREGAWRAPLLDALAAGLPHGGTAVEPGAGTGANVLALAERRPDARVVAVDPDGDALDLARAKPGADRVEWVQAPGDRLPLPDGAADAVLLSLLLHHLAPDAKRAVLREARRVLRTGGALHVADWGRPQGPGARASFLALQLLDGFEGTRDHAAGVVPDLVEAAGFTPPRRRARLRTAFGTLEVLHAVSTPTPDGAPTRDRTAAQAG